MGTSRKILLDSVQVALDEGVAAFFVGAGLSRAAGYVDWRGLIRDIAEELGLDVNRESDLIALAQYLVNQRRGRAAINQKLIEEFTRDAVVTENHRLIAALPVAAVWTTNYDTLLEDAFRAAHKRINVKVSPESLATTLPKRNVTIYKMHGDVSAPDNAFSRSATTRRITATGTCSRWHSRAISVSKTFLFLGYSFSDPNINYILARIRGLLGRTGATTSHHAARSEDQGTWPSAGSIRLRREKAGPADEDLKTYGIQTHLVEDYDEILRSSGNNERVDRRNIFISGSAADFGPLGRDRIEDLARRLGTEIISRGYNLVTGLGLGIGGAVTVGAMEALYRTPVSHLDERATLARFLSSIRCRGRVRRLWTRYRQRGGSRRRGSRSSSRGTSSPERNRFGRGRARGVRIAVARRAYRSPSARPGTSRLHFGPR